MATYISDLNNYNILVFKSGKTLKIQSGGFGYGSSEIFFLVFPEDYSFEELEEIFSNAQNTQKIQIVDSDRHNIYATATDYIILTNMRKLYNEVYYEGYTDEGQYFQLTTDLIKVELRKQNANDLVNQLQSDVEYMAIMTDVDLNKE